MEQGKYNNTEFSLELFKKVFREVFYKPPPRQQEVRLHFLTQASEDEFDRVFRELIKKDLKNIYANKVQ